MKSKSLLATIAGLFSRKPDPVPRPDVGLAGQHYDSRPFPGDPKPFYRYPRGLYEVTGFVEHDAFNKPKYIGAKAWVHAPEGLTLSLEGYARGDMYFWFEEDKLWLDVYLFGVKLKPVRGIRASSFLAMNPLPEKVLK